MSVEAEALFNEVVRLMSRWSPKGEKVTANGVRLICPTPHVGPEAWLHVLFPPLAPGKVAEMEGRLGLPLPADFKDFLLRANGLMLFTYRVSVWGLRETMSRRGDAAWQPHDLVDLNYETERPDGSPDDVVFFASADDGASWCFFEFAGEGYRIGKTDRHNFTPGAYWPDFGSWLIDEARASEPLFDSDGETVAHANDG